MKFTAFRSVTALTMALLAVTTTAILADDQTDRRLPAGGNGNARGVGQGLDNERSIKVDKTANLAGTARQAKNDRKHVGVRGLGISPPGHSDEIDLVVSQTFTASCRVTSADGSSQPCDTGRIVLTSAEDEPTFTVLSTDEVTGETSGFSMSGSKKFYKVNQKKNSNVDATDATDEAFIPPAWACHNDEVAQALTDKDQKRRLVGHSHDGHHHHHAAEDNHHHHHHHDGADLDLGKALEVEGLKLRGTRRLAHERPADHRKLETYYTDNTGYKYSYEVGILVEVDQNLVNKKGGVNGMSQYIEDLFAGMNIIYEKEVDTHLSIVGIDVVSRYDSATGTGDALGILENTYSAYYSKPWPSSNPDLIHAILGRSLGGGVAYLGQICSKSWGLGVSAGIAGNYDIDDPKAMVWDITVIAHELGHNFDADHTHEDYGGGRVDNCGVDSDPNQGGLQPTCTGVSAGSGSIMSYCHLCVGSSNLSPTLGGYRTGPDAWVRSNEFPVGDTLSVDPQRVTQRMHAHVSTRGSCVVPLGEVPPQICNDDSQCNDNNSCTIDSCNVGVGCVHTAIPGCCGNGMCEAGEDTGNCPADCPCVDNPEGWYDADGPTYSCAWYGSGSNCASYGDSYANFGTTANQACCVCGGGSPTSGGPTSPTPVPPTNPPPTNPPPTNPPPTNPPPTAAPCDFAPCKNGGQCTNSGASYICNCAGTGYSGPTCQNDVDECAAGTDNCDANADCSNTVGGHTCTCNPGFAGNGISCTPIECGANQKVVTNACVNCEAGTTNAAGDLASGSDTTCDPILCGANQKVVSNECVNCEPGTTNTAGDDASSGNTSCDAILCGANQWVQNNGCVNCPAGTTNAAGDDASGPNTSCDITYCGQDEYVSSNICVGCPAGTTNAAGDDASGANTSCDVQPTPAPPTNPPPPPPPPPPPATCVDVTVEIRTDYWGYETSWSISDSSSSVLMSGNSYGNSETYYVTECLPNDANYVFTIYDSYGDGILYGGGYKITAAGNVLAEGGGNFGSSDYRDFALGNAPPGPCNECIDSPLGWYDIDGPTYSCAWYADGTNCADYGDGYANFGTTANQACCACGGGESACSAAAPPPSSAFVASAEASARRKPQSGKKKGTKQKSAADAPCPEKPKNGCSADCHCPGSFCKGNGTCK